MRREISGVRPDVTIALTSVLRDEQQTPDEKTDDPRTTAELVEIATRSARTGQDDGLSEAVGALRARGTRDVLEAGSQLCRSTVPSERSVGASILGQLGAPESVFPEERFRVLSTLISAEKDPAVLGVAATAMGQLSDPRAVSILVGLKRHPNPEVRFGVVAGLLAHTAPEDIESLIELSTDTNDDVRNWATFGLGSMIAEDTPAIREALLRRAGDGHDEIRGEALVGLAARHDARAVLLIAKELASSKNVGKLAVEAAAEAADPALLAALEKLATWWDVDEALLENAIRKCQGTPKPR